MINSLWDGRAGAAPVRGIGTQASISLATGRIAAACLGLSPESAR